MISIRFSAEFILSSSKGYEAALRQALRRAQDIAQDTAQSALTKRWAQRLHRGVMAVTEDPIVSSDIIQDPHASVVDLGMTRVVDSDLVKVMSWYDKEWGFTSQMIRRAVDTARAIGLV